MQTDTKPMKRNILLMDSRLWLRDFTDVVLKCYFAWSIRKQFQPQSALVTFATKIIPLQATTLFNGRSF
jgi:hypothetical protein